MDPRLLAAFSSKLIGQEQPRAKSSIHTIAQIIHTNARSLVITTKPILACLFYLSHCSLVNTNFFVAFPLFGRAEMGKKLDALFGRNSFKTYKFKPQLNLATSRLAILKNQRQVKCSQARSDVLQLLQRGFHERALLRVEYVIKEQNMLDAFVMMEGYCNLLTERVDLIEQDNRVCPEELNEAISTLLFAASRCGEFPELQEIREMFRSRYGKEFVGRAVELRNNCGVNKKMIQKLSTRQPDLDNRMKVLKEIAAEHGIALQLEEGSCISAEENLHVNKRQNKAEIETSNSVQGNPVNNSQISPKETGKVAGFSDSFKTRKKYKDVADAAQAAFESAAYAAEAARAAVKLSRSESLDPDDHNTHVNPQRKATDRQKLMNLASESKNQEIHGELQTKESKHSKNEAESESTISSSDSTEDNLHVTTMSFDEVDPVKLLEKDIVFYDSDSGDSGFSHQEMPSSSEAQNVEWGHLTANAAEGSAFPSKQQFGQGEGPTSVRTTRLCGSCKH